MIATPLSSLYHYAHESKPQVSTSLQDKVSEVAESYFQLPSHELRIHTSQESLLANSARSVSSTETPLSAWRFPITEVNCASLPSVPFIFEDGEAFVSPKDFYLLLKYSLFLQQIVQGTESDGEEKQEEDRSFRINKSAVDLRGFGPFTNQSLEQALKTLRTKRITKQAIEEGGAALLESLSLNEGAIFNLEEDLITEEFEIEESTTLTQLNVQISLKNSLLKTLDNFRYFLNLRNLKLCDCTIQDFSATGDLKNLRDLDLSRTGVSNISFLQKLVKLSTLALDHCKQIQDFSSIRELQNLQALSLSNTQVSDITVLQELIKLNLTSCEKMQDFFVIGELQNLETLNLSFTNISDISFLQGLPKLTYFFLNGCKQIRNFSGLAAPKNLEILELSWTNVSDISYIEKLSKLNTLNLEFCRQIQDFSVIETLQNLKQLDLRGTARAHLSRFR